MSNNINLLQDQLDDLAEDIKADAELILAQIDLDQLLKNPDGYVKTVALEFVTQHEDMIQLGVKIGRKIARRILHEIPDQR